MGGLAHLTAGDYPLLMELEENRRTVSMGVLPTRYTTVVCPGLFDFVC